MHTYVSSININLIAAINECEEGTHKCEQICTDTEEYYTCSCRDKYVLDENGFNCTERGYNYSLADYTIILVNYSLIY